MHFMTDFTLLLEVGAGSGLQFPTLNTTSLGAGCVQICDLKSSHFH